MSPVYLELTDKTCERSHTLISLLILAEGGCLLMWKIGSCLSTPYYVNNVLLATFQCENKHLTGYRWRITKNQSSESSFSSLNLFYIFLLSPRKLALVARLSLTSLQNCPFMEVLNKGRTALVNSYCYCCYKMRWLTTTLMCAVFRNKMCFETYIVRSHFFVDSVCVGRLVVQSHLAGLECNAIF